LSDLFVLGHDSRKFWTERLIGVGLGPTAWLNIEFSAAFPVFGTGHQAPGLAVFFVARHPPFARGKEFHGANGAEYHNRHHIPNVLRHDVGDKKVDVRSGVGSALDVAAGMEAVSILAVAVRRLHLHAPGTGAVVEDEIVAVALSPGLGDGEAEGGGFVEEGGFGDLSAALGGQAGVGWIALTAAERTTAAARG